MGILSARIAAPTLSKMQRYVQIVALMKVRGGLKVHILMDLGYRLRMNMMKLRNQNLAANGDGKSVGVLQSV